MTFTISLIILAGVFMGACYGLTGIGSVFAVPILVLLAKLDPHQAVCIAMITVLGMAVGTLFKQSGEIAYKPGFIIAIAGAIGAPFGSWIGKHISGENLMTFLAVIMFLLGAHIIFKKESETKIVPHVNFVLLSFAGFLCGILAGLFGLGSVLIVPSLLLIAGLSPHQAISTATPATLVVGIFATLSHWFSGLRIPFEETTLFAIASFTGLFVGFYLKNKISTHYLRRILGMSMPLISILILIKK